MSSEEEVVYSFKTMKRFENYKIFKIFGFLSFFIAIYLLFEAILNYNYITGYQVQPFAIVKVYYEGILIIYLILISIIFSVVIYKSRNDLNVISMREGEIIIENKNKVIPLIIIFILYTSSFSFIRERIQQDFNRIIYFLFGIPLISIIFILLIYFIMKQLVEAQYKSIILKLFGLMIIFLILLLLSDLFFLLFVEPDLIPLSMKKSIDVGLFVGSYINTLTYIYISNMMICCIYFTIFGTLLIQNGRKILKLSV